MDTIRWMFVGFVLLCTAACASSPPANPAELRGLIRIYEPECMREIESDADTLRMMSQAGITADDLCKCTGQKIFGSFTENDLKQFMRDSSKYDDVSDHEPWESRIYSATLRCLGGEGSVAINPLDELPNAIHPPDSAESEPWQSFQGIRRALEDGAAGIQPV